jgi:hypothetical protein
MSATRHGFAAMLIAGLLCGAVQGVAAPRAPRLSGTIVGFVTDSAGVPQMGATILLFNHFERLVQKALTNEKGAFGFDGIAPDTYSLQVSLASFVPAFKRNILVQPGVRSFLSVNLASVLSSIELIYTAPGQGALMSDDWKWVLRSSMSTRPVLRMLPSIDISDPASSPKTSMFSQTRGLVRVSASDMGSVSSFSNEPDLGTAFALATSLYGTNQLHFSGNFGYASQAGTPAASFRTSFAPSIAGVTGPQVNVTMRQLFLPGRTGAAIMGGQRDSNPGLRTMSVGISEKKKLTEALELDYGLTLESVSFLDRLNYFSPFARLSYDFGNSGVVEFGYSSGIPPADLLAPNGQADAEFQRDLAALSAFPRISRRGGSVAVQRAQNFELSYKKSLGSRSVSVGAYRETVANAAVSVQGPADLFTTDDLFPDPFSSSSIFNIGKFHREGAAAAVTQNFGDQLGVTFAYGNTGVLRVTDRTLHANDADELRNAIRPARRSWASAALSGTVPGTGTKFTTSYQWTDYAALTAGHRYLTQRLGPEPGLNMYIRQPIGTVPGLSGRVEATAEIRNLLEQGYLPISLSDGRRLVLVHSPRALRGGLSFIF